MFTGLVQTIGKVVSLQNSILKITTTQDYLADLKLGDSISVNGACLSLIEKKNDQFSVFVSKETAEVTNIPLLKSNTIVNLEKPLKLNDFLHGHLMQGHIDGLGIVEDIYKNQAGYTLKIKYPPSIEPFLILKGSIAVNGISLTIAKLYFNIMEIAVIPETYHNTNLKLMKKYDKVNLETDLIGKYVQKIMKK